MLMPQKLMTFNALLEPLADELPEAFASAIGATVARHTYLDWVLGQVMYDLMEISIKQGRVIMKMPRPKVYIAAVKRWSHSAMRSATLAAVPMPLVRFSSPTAVIMSG